MRRCSTQPMPNMIAIETNGITASQPPRTAINPTKTKRNRMSVTRTTVVEAKKSRTCSYSVTRRARAPVLPRWVASGRLRTLSSRRWESRASILRPTSSTSPDLANLKLYSTPIANSAPKASTHRLVAALFGMIRSYTFIVKRGRANARMLINSEATIT